MWACLLLYRDSLSYRTLLNLSDGAQALLHIAMIGILVLYATYFALVAYISFFQSASFKEMKHSYKVSMIMTLAVIVACAVVIGLITEERDVNTKATLGVALTALLNIYLYLIAYLYSPAMESLEDIQLKHARKEHEHIMNQFYEQELPDITHRTLEAE